MHLLKPPHHSLLTTQIECKSTRHALLLNGLFNEPLIVLIGLYAAILVKEFDASSWQISVYTALRPVMSLLAFYLSTYVVSRREKLISQIVMMGVLCRLPFFFFPWIEQAWTMIGCAAIYLLLSSSGVPAWIEVLKSNLSSESRGRLFSTSAVMGYIEGLILAIVFGNLMKHEEGSWRWLFPLGAIFGILSLLWQMRIPMRWKPTVVVIDVLPTLASRIAEPMRQAWQLLKYKADFRRFQLGFMGCGGAVMLVYAVMPHYLIDQLQVSYKDIAIATAFFKAIGYACSSRAWCKRLDSDSLFRASSWIFFFVAAFPLLLLLAVYTKWALWAAFAVYGVGLAGNHLIWHMSAPLFSEEEDSTPYSNVGILLVGIRGLFFPMLGAWMSSQMGIAVVLWLSVALCLTSALYMRSVHDRLKAAKFKS